MTHVIKPDGFEECDSDDALGKPEGFDDGDWLVEGLGPELREPDGETIQMTHLVSQKASTMVSRWSKDSGRSCENQTVRQIAETKANH